MKEWIGMSGAQLDERIEKVDRAKDFLDQAAELVAEAVRDTNLEANTHAYLVDKISNSARPGNPYDLSCRTLRVSMEDEWGSAQAEVESFLAEDD